MMDGWMGGWVGGWMNSFNITQYKYTLLINTCAYIIAAPLFFLECHVVVK